jgi:hypothetical protein
MNTEDLDIMMMKEKLLSSVLTSIEDLSYYTYTSNMEPSYDISSSIILSESSLKLNIDDKKVEVKAQGPKLEDEVNLN